MNPYIKRKLNITFQYGLDGHRKSFYVSKTAIWAVISAIALLAITSVAFLIYLVPYLSEKGEMGRIAQENKLLRDKIDYYATQIDSIKAQIGVQEIQEEPSETSYPYIDPKKNHEPDLFYDPWLEARISMIERGLLLIHEQLNAGELDEFEQLLRQYPSLANSDGKPSIYPTFGTFSDGWGMRIHPIFGKPEFHTGIDIVNRAGTPIYASAAGIITYVGYERGYGRYIKIRHSQGYETRYAHLYSAQTKKGEFVKKGQIIALMGSTGTSTGSHLHYEVLVNGAKVNPSSYLNRIDFDLYALNNDRKENHSSK